MKIKKTLFSTEIEFYPGEFEEIMQRNRADVFFPIFKWLNKNFGFNFFPIKRVKKDKEI